MEIVAGLFFVLMLLLSLGALVKRAPTCRCNRPDCGGGCIGR